MEDNPTVGSRHRKDIWRIFLVIKQGKDSNYGNSLEERTLLETHAGLNYIQKQRYEDVITLSLGN